jgi:predicted extracellular nuclease
MKLSPSLCVIFVIFAGAVLPLHAQLKISQVYGGGGNSGSVYKNDFIEILNTGSTAASLTGLSVQYSSAAGTSWQVTNLSGTIQPGHYYLIQEAVGAGGTTSLPTPDATGTIAMSATDGKVALVNSTTALTGSCPSTNVVDLVGYGTANCFEGSAAAPQLSATASDSRKGGGYTDTNSNTNDFTKSTGTNSFTPRNSSVNAYGVSGTGSPNPVSAGSSTTLMAVLTPFANSTSIAVACDLSSIGGSSAFSLPNTATNTYSAAYSVPGSVAAATYTLSCSVTDAQSRTSQFNISQSVTGSSTPPTATGSASPNPVNQGSSVHLDATITPGANPTSITTSAACDLTQIGGGSSVTLPVDYTVPAPTAANTYSLSCTVTDDVPRSSTFSISLTVQVPPPVFHSVPEITGSGTTSPLAGVRVETRGVITAVRGTTGSTKGFYIEAIGSDRTSDANTSNGLLIFIGSSSLPSCAIAGRYVQIDGTVQDFVPSTAPVGSIPLTELSGITACTDIGGGADNSSSLPSAVTLTTTNIAAGGSATQARKFLAMRVNMPSAVATGGSLGNLTETAATSTASGVFFVTLTGVTRPFRATGIMDTRRPSDAAATVPHYNASPEVLRIDTTGLTGGTTFDVATGDAFTNISGIMDYDTADGVYQIYSNAAGIGSHPSSPGLSATPVAAPLASDLTVANFNVERFYNDLNDGNGNSVTLSTAAYQGRLKKLSLAVRNVLRMPDIVTFEEIEGPNLGSGPQTFPVPQDVVNQINADAQSNSQGNPNYNWCAFATNDASLITVTVIYKQTKVALVDCNQFGAATTFIKPAPPNNTSILNDRPPVVFRGTVTAPGSDSGMTFRIVANHLRSFDSVDSPGDTGDFPRTKRNEQAKYLAKLISGNLSAEQTSNWTATDNLLVTGDFNAYDFSDGYVDTLNCAAGSPGAANTQYFDAAELAVTSACASIYSPGLTNLTATDPLQRYSYSFNGAAQRIDHILVNSKVLPRVRQFMYARNNADFPEGPTYRNDTTRPERVSDHDMPIVYLILPMEVTSRTRINATAPALNRATGRYNATISVTNTGVAALTGPVYVFFANLPAGVTLPDLPTSNGVPYATINIPGGLASGATSGSIGISFADPSNARIAYTTTRFDGSF